MIPFAIDATHGEARAGRLLLPRGEVATPCFMPVGTRGAVRTLDSDDLASLGAGIILGNTYHLMLRPGHDLIARRGGLHGFIGWGGSILTDSGGFQIMSLNAKVSDEGVEFSSVYDGSRLWMTPETAVEAQNAIGSDIQMALDVCPELPASPEVIREALDRTTAWAKRAREAFLQSLELQSLETESSPQSETSRLRKTESQISPHREGSASLSPETEITQSNAASTAHARYQFGILQGGTSEELRRESALSTTEIGFDGYALGGLSVGEDRSERLPAIAAACANLPEEQPRYLMGVGDPLSLIEAISAGVDMFDCVLPTRLARHGTALTSQGRLNLKNSSHAEDDTPIDPDFPESPAASYSRAYLRHLLMVKEPTAARILTLHNLAWLLHLMEEARRAIADGSLARLHQKIVQTWQ